MQGASSNKENIPCDELPQFVQEYLNGKENTPTQKTPLSKFNGATSKSAKTRRKGRYSYITPVSTPLSPSDKHRRRVRSDGSCQRTKAEQFSKEVPLNALVYQQVVSIVEDLKQEHERLVQMKDKRISVLEQELAASQSQTKHQQNFTELPADFDEEVDKYVDDIIKRVAVDLLNESCHSGQASDQASGTESSNLRTTQFETISSDDEDLSEDNVAVNNSLLLQRAISGMCKKLQSLSDDEACLSDHETPTLFTDAHAQLMDKQTGLLEPTETVQLIDASTATTPIRTVPAGTMITPVVYKHSDVMTDDLSTLSTSTSPLSQPAKVSSSAGTMMTPRQCRSVTLMTESVETETISTSPIVIRGSSNEHEMELAKLEEEKSEYKELYYASQQKLKELEAKLDIYEDISDVCSKVKQSQLDLQTSLVLGFQKVTRLAKEHEEKRSTLHIMYDGKLKVEEDEKTRLEQELSDALDRMTDVQSRLDSVSKQNSDFKVQVQCMESEKGRLSSELEGMIATNQDLSDRLNVSTMAKAALAEELVAVSSAKVTVEQELSVKQAEQEDLTRQLEASEHNIQQLQTNLSSLQLELTECKRDLVSTIKDLEDERKKTQHVTGLLTDTRRLLEHRAKESKLLTDLLQESEKNLKDLQENLDSNLESLELEKKNLYHTLESRESDLDAITQERDQLAKLSACQKLAYEGLRKDLQKNQKAVLTLKEVQQQLKIQENASKENEEFLEQEKAGLLSDLRMQQASLDSMTKEYISLQEENLELKENLIMSRKKCCSLEVDLAESKVRNDMMLQRHNTNFVNLKRISEMMSVVERQISDSTQNQLTLRDKQAKSDTLGKSQNEKQQPKSSRKSIVLSVLDVAKDTDKRLDLLAEDVEAESSPAVESFSDTLPEPVIIGTSASAFCRVASCVVEEANTHSQNPIDENNLTVDEADSENICTETDELHTLLGNVEAMACHMVSSLGDLDKMFCDGVASLQTEITNTKALLEVEQSRYKSLKSHTHLLEQDINSLHLNENGLRQDLSRLRQQVAQRDGELKEAQVLIMDRTTKLEAAAEQMRTYKRDENETERLGQLCDEKDTELAILRNTLEEKLAAQTASECHTTAASTRELVQLKKENMALQNEAGRTQAKMDAVVQKCVRRMDAYKCNWEKAEKEVHRLDDLVEKMIQGLQHHSEYIMKSKDLKDLVVELGLPIKK